MSEIAIERVVTSGQGLENNVWLVGNDQEVLIIDASHQTEPILEAIGRRQVVAIAITHAHNDHINAAVKLREATGAHTYLHHDDLRLWQQTYPNAHPDVELVDNGQLLVGDVALKILHTPGHTLGSCCFYYPDAKTIFTGDTLFPGGPGATTWDYASFDMIIDSIKMKLFTLPAETKVLPGHGDNTTIGTEAPSLDIWIKRRW